ncbi:methyltransferase domain-containing protein [Mucilaginibacter sabulilitoris]|uniref:Methyltransferase domain-containing protein n=1 Tax=Mucilaginibacter sabulilitoris TaxID=1173583 RepID=A0ABZ0TF70_9SPHI|nr:methyltransferase domain-containing protein [Mucilaginibacter sabulilitoris]WPU91648.1 methyltransferase domain-containing protein [Mucilaginibacter sabulilitoris]
MYQLKKRLKKFLGLLPWQEDEAGQQKQIDSYFKRNEIKKIQFGCGPNYLADWLNTDICKSSDDVVYMDITRQLPLPAGTVHFITSEHLLEHITFCKAREFLKECFRVLKPGGIIRITTPDLETVIDLYTNQKEDARAYVDHIVRHFIPGVTYNENVFVINNAFRNWGHQFLYDRSTLVHLLEETGYIAIEQVLPGESKHPLLQKIDFRDQSGFKKINEFEVMVFEAARP